MRLNKRCSVCCSTMTVYVCSATTFGLVRRASSCSDLDSISTEDYEARYHAACPPTCLDLPAGYQINRRDGYQTNWRDGYQTKWRKEAGYQPDVGRQGSLDVQHAARQGLGRDAERANAKDAGVKMTRPVSGGLEDTCNIRFSF